MGKVQKVADQRMLPTLKRMSWYTFALDVQSPRTVRTCHSVGTTRSREFGIKSSGRKKIAEIVKKNHLGFSQRRRVHWQWYCFWRYCTFVNHQIFPGFWSQNKGVSSAKNLMFCHVHAQMVLSRYHFFLKLFVSKVGDITTILGFFFLTFCQKPCISCGEKRSAFFVLTIGAAT